MCGRYYIAEEDSPLELEHIIETLNRKEIAFKACGEIFPSDVVPVLALNRREKISAFAFEWGYTTSDGKRIINARSETALDKALFRESMLFRRCAVPASGYYEWKHVDKKREKYAIRSAGKELTYMAGIYRIVNDRPEFVILTKSPNSNISFIHDRMPVVLEDGNVDSWLDRSMSPDDLANGGAVEYMAV